MQSLTRRALNERRLRIAFDFDALLEQLAEADRADRRVAPAIHPSSPVASALDQVELPANDATVALLERQLRESDEQRAAEARRAAARSVRSGSRSWKTGAAIVMDRNQRRAS